MTLDQEGAFRTLQEQVKNEDVIIIIHYSPRTRASNIYKANVDQSGMIYLLSDALNRFKVAALNIQRFITNRFMFSKN